MDIEELKERYLQGARNFQKVSLSIPNIDEVLAKVSELEIQSSERLPKEVLEMIFKELVINNFDLSTADFSEATVVGSKFTQVKLDNVNFGKANLYCAKAISCSFIRANLTEANLERSSFYAVDLSNATLEKVILSQSSLGDVKLDMANLSEADLSSTYIHNCNFNNANLSRAKLIKAELWGVQFENVNLSNSNFSEAKLENCNLSGADLRGADLSKASLTLPESLNKLKLFGFDIQQMFGANMTGAYYNKNTKFPDDFNPKLLGMVYKE
ncbi:pentapeptide repeat-containing protein [Nostoc spongiaeforme FACHB-130]|uniref:Pentapeptide repeat-containing protein n=1 Tax=Nostoc spongiaeforme FACHB-130 TaxID=1357510 RepID=A0ABR8G3K7_9NOSO|nr:pentapeptide repeat-containing protein [Nostoc spongiaeforme]MBD2597792.1 pentapeptide repeat-containing protein [Nostoc spongiaeforme FACHB-130]